MGTQFPSPVSLPVAGLVIPDLTTPDFTEVSALSDSLCL